jgi:hypothetical protein
MPTWRNSTFITSSAALTKRIKKFSNILVFSVNPSPDKKIMQQTAEGF